MLSFSINHQLTTIYKVNMPPKNKTSPWMTISEYVNEAKEKIAEIDIDGIVGEYNYDGDELTLNTKERIKSELKTLAELKADTIIVNINSFGGNINHGISIHDLLAQSKAKIITKINGFSASAATIIAQAGEVRQMSDNSLYLIHHATVRSFDGNIFDLEDAKEALSQLDNIMLNVYAKRSGSEREEIVKLMKENNGNGKWLTAEEAKAVGLVDEVFEPMKAVALVIPEDNYLNLPPLPEGYGAQKKKSFFESLQNFFTNKNSNQEDDDEMNETQFKQLIASNGKIIEGITALGAVIAEKFPKKEEGAQPPAAPAVPVVVAPAQTEADNKAQIASLVEGQKTMTASIAALTEKITNALKDPAGATKVPPNTGANQDAEVF